MVGSRAPGTRTVVRGFFVLSKPCQCFCASGETHFWNNNPQEHNLVNCLGSRKIKILYGFGCYFHLQQKVTNTTIAPSRRKGEPKGWGLWWEGEIGGWDTEGWDIERVPQGVGLELTLKRLEEGRPRNAGRAPPIPRGGGRSVLPRSVKNWDPGQACRIFQILS